MTTFPYQRPGAAGFTYRTGNQLLGSRWYMFHNPNDREISEATAVKDARLVSGRAQIVPRRRLRWTAGLAR